MFLKVRYNIHAVNAQDKRTRFFTYVYMLVITTQIKIKTFPASQKVPSPWH